ncbi:MAG: HupE/UreJ family protein [Phenylobacterium sp.]|nr:HupE/UreJ family protein [Phenylobacterium sp.]
MVRLLLAALVLALGLAGLAVRPAGAHTLSESHSAWEINGADIDLVMTIPLREVQRIGGGEAMPPDAAVEAYLAARVYPSSAGRRCALVPPVQAPAAAAGFRKYDFTFRCPSPKDLSITSRAFFDLVPSHTNFAEVQDQASGAFAEQLITRDRQSVEVSGEGASRLKTASFLDFVGMGMMHIFTGVDHMSFLLGLVLISRRLRDLVFVVSGFTIGHSLTLALAVTGVIRPHAEFIDALVALTIVLIGAENIAEQTRKPLAIAAVLGGGLGLMALAAWAGVGQLPALLLLGGGLFTSNYLMMSGRLADAGRFRMMITLIFGLIHGFGFASNLLAMQLPTERLAELLVGFNVGVELGQLSLVLGVTGLVLGLRRLRLATPRPITADLAASFLVGLGVYWFVTRSYP